VNPPLILLVEDSPDDVFFLKRALRHAQVEADLRVVTNGREAQSYLSGAAPYADRRKHPLPWLVLLDLRMPLMSGLEVLAWIRSRPNLANLSVIVLTSSLEDSEMQRTFELGVVSYLVKPPTAEMVEKTFRFLRQSQPVAGKNRSAVETGAEPFGNGLVLWLTLAAVVIAAAAFAGILLSR
jgi:CheY-like chemotaxis protein